MPLRFAAMLRRCLWRLSIAVVLLPLVSSAASVTLSPANLLGSVQGGWTHTLTPIPSHTLLFASAPVDFLVSSAVPVLDYRFSPSSLFPACGSATVNPSPCLLNFTMGGTAQATINEGLTNFLYPGRPANFVSSYATNVTYQLTFTTTQFTPFSHVFTSGAEVAWWRSTDIIYQVAGSLTWTTPDGLHTITLPMEPAIARGMVTFGYEYANDQRGHVIDPRPISMVDLALTDVPEPASCLYTASAFAWLCWLRHRRRSSGA